MQDLSLESATAVWHYRRAWSQQGCVMVLLGFCIGLVGLSVRVLQGAFSVLTIDAVVLAGQVLEVVGIATIIAGIATAITFAVLAFAARRGRDADPESPLPVEIGEYFGRHRVVEIKPSRVTLELGSTMVVAGAWRLG